ncbi:MAG: S41 family peptidase [Pirellulales bacterium]|nr:S41 family peptidase [Pirellulales bacterium]
MSHRNLLLILATAVISYACYVRAEQNPYARYVAAGYSVIDRWSLVDTPDQKLFDGAMQGMVKVLKEQGDEYSAFVDEKHLEEFREDMLQEFGGVGVKIRFLGKPPLPTVTSPPSPGTPAFEAKIRTGDRILAIDQQPTAEMNISQVLQQMRGPVGDPVTLSIQRKDLAQPMEISLVRQVITVESILGDIHDAEGQWLFCLEQDPRLGYVRIEKFGDKSLDEISRVLADLTGGADDTSAIQALLLDVRDNSGGALDAAVGISDLFLRAGLPIVATRGRDAVTRDRFVSTGRSGYTDIPLVVLVNNDSASAPMARVRSSASCAWSRDAVD